ncbi:MAG: Rieske (2Fe-2S) protein [Actinomycetota bacterium]|nr:Rieske (2Fe-2S) protein [Actinomycetota bacterium]
MPDSPTAQERAQAAVDRRTVLRGVAVTGAFGASGSLLAGCGGGADGSGASGGSAAGGAAAGKELGPASEVPVGGGKIYTEQQVVVTQPSKGEFKAFSSICQHQGCPVASVSDGTINCDCHGSKYKIEDGSVVTGPATRGLPKMQVEVDGGDITLA